MQSEGDGMGVSQTGPMCHVSVGVSWVGPPCLGVYGCISMGGAMSQLVCHEHSGWGCISVGGTVSQ